MRKILILSFLLAFLGLGGGSVWADDTSKNALNVVVCCESFDSTPTIYGLANLSKSGARVFFVGKFKPSIIRAVLTYQDSYKNVTELDLSNAQINESSNNSTYNESTGKHNYNITFLPENTQMTNLKYLAWPNEKYWEVYNKHYNSKCDDYEDGEVSYLCPNVETLVIPYGTRKVGDVFKGMKNLVTLQLPQTLDSILGQAFSGCEKLKNVYSQQNCLTEKEFICTFQGKDYYRYTLSGAPGTCNLPKNLKYTLYDAFSGCPFDAIVIPESVWSMAPGTFLRPLFELSDVDFYYTLPTVHLLGKGEGGEKDGLYTPYFGVNGWLYPYFMYEPSLDQILTTKQDWWGDDHRDDAKGYAVLHYRPDMNAAQVRSIANGVYKTSKEITSLDLSKCNYYPSPLFGNERMSLDNNCIWMMTYAYQKNLKTDYYNGLNVLPSRRADVPLPDAEFPKYEDGKWFTLCLPISLNAKAVEHIYGKDAEIYTLDRVTRNDDCENRVHLYFTKKCTEIKSHAPYIVRVTNPTGHNDKLWDFTDWFDTEKVEYNNVVVSCEDEVLNEKWWYVFTGNLEGLKAVKDSVDSGNFLRYRPRYAYYLGAENDEVSWYYQDTEKKRVWKPYTCALFAVSAEHKYKTSLTPGVTEDDAFRDSSGKVLSKSSVYSNLGEDATTGIDYNTVDFVTPDRYVDGNVYTLSGQLVRHNSTTTDGLPKGIYVCNGRKIMVK